MHKIIAALEALRIAIEEETCGDCGLLAIGLETDPGGKERFGSRMISTMATPYGTARDPSLPFDVMTLGGVQLEFLSQPITDDKARHLPKGAALGRFGKTLRVKY